MNNVQHCHTSVSPVHIIVFLDSCLGMSDIVDPNPNTSWLHQPALPYAYGTLVFVFWLLFRVFFEPPLCATVLLQVHAFATFIFVHWLKGAPEGGVMQEQVAHLTFWEQIDDGYLGTPARRTLFLSPIILYFVALYFNGDDVVTLLLNSASTLLVLVPKHEALFGVRLFGVNKLE
jgi:hypothetical protein